MKEKYKKHFRKLINKLNSVGFVEINKSLYDIKEEDYEYQKTKRKKEDHYVFDNNIKNFINEKNVLCFKNSNLDISNYNPDDEKNVYFVIVISIQPNIFSVGTGGIVSDLTISENSFLLPNNILYDNRTYEMLFDEMCEYGLNEINRIYKTEIRQFRISTIK